MSQNAVFRLGDGREYYVTKRYVRPAVDSLGQWFVEQSNDAFAEQWEICNQVPRTSVDGMSEKDKLWELYLHTLSGYHGNVGANSATNEELAINAFKAAKQALAVWDARL